MAFLFISIPCLDFNVLTSFLDPAILNIFFVINGTCEAEQQRRHVSVLCLTKTSENGGSGASQLFQRQCVNVDIEHPCLIHLYYMFRFGCFTTFRRFYHYFAKLHVFLFFTMMISLPDYSRRITCYQSSWIKISLSDYSYLSLLYF